MEIQDEEDEADREHQRGFIEATRLAIEMTRELSELHELGHFHFGHDYRADIPICSAEMEEACLTIQREKQEWSKLLAHLRQVYYYINYFYFGQLGRLVDFFLGRYPVKSPEMETAVDLLNLVRPWVSKADIVRKWYGVAKGMTGVEEAKQGAQEERRVQCLRGLHDTKPTLRLQALAELLDMVFDSLPAAPIPAERAGRGGAALLLTSGTPIVVSTYHNEREMHATVLALYEQLEGVEGLLRHRFLICSSSTSSPEIDMFVHRVFSPRIPVHGLFCVVNAHLLTHECRAYLTKSLLCSSRLRHQESRAIAALVIPLSADKCITELGLDVHNVAPLTGRLLRDMVAQRLGRNVLVVTAPAAGMGKTEFIHSHAEQHHGTRVRSLAVGDGITRASLVSRLKAMYWEDGGGACLHIDISSVEFPAEVNMALFELLVLGSLQVGLQVVHLPSHVHTYVEVARAMTLQHGPLRRALYALDAFHEEVLHWHMERLMVPQDVDSDMQVVCNYLALLDSGLLHQMQLFFDGDEQNAVALSAAQCRLLLANHFYSHFDAACPPSLNTLRVFLGVLADQLRKLSESVYFRLEFVDDPAVRTAVVNSLVTVSRDFATRSVRHARRRQEVAWAQARGEKQQGDEKDAAAAPNWLDLGLVRWEDDNQLMVLFHPQGTCMTALYRRLADVNPELRHMIEHQGRVKLKDYSDMNDAELREQLALICSRRVEELGDYEHVITPDNLLKFAMMTTRIQARIPVIVMGETGCGKSTLIRFAANAMGAAFEVLNLHAGRSADEIIEFVERCEELAGEDCQVWAFLDEINTTPHLGLINDIVCHRHLNGRPIHPDVTFLCAVNPYRLKAADGIMAGLDSQQKRNKPDALSRLVYRVYPLPETMLSFVWDFGSLDERDEQAYIRAVMRDLELEMVRAGIRPAAAAILHELVACCHCLIRTREDRSAVSMRDVRRCKLLARWFFEQKRRTPSAAEASNEGDHFYGRGIKRVARLFVWNKAGAHEKERAACEAMVLAVGLCYRSRLPLPYLRQELDAHLSQIFRQRLGTFVMDEHWVAQTLLDQQREYVSRMALGPGIAMNEALLENTFVLLVCILLKIPVFLVGKPGSSKTLAMKRLESTLRGADSRDPFWSRFGEIKVVSYQGSESSTSEGVLQAFSKATSYAQSNQGGSNVVVLLDEVGLAEISRFNPLKVLHALLEVEEYGKLAVVGISNWSLDASKQSRAIHISRPEPDQQQLVFTAEAILQSMGCHVTPDIKMQMERLAEAYTTYCEDQDCRLSANFHGLRDYYWTVKQLARSIKQHGRLVPESVAMAISRNFSGLCPPDPTAFDHLLRSMCNDGRDLLNTRELCGPRELIRANLADQECRHLMLLTSGDAILNTMEGLFQEAGLPSPRIIIGSKLKGDACEAYSYRILSEIIQSLETGRSLVLKDLSQIYGSLYDCLNQSYTIVAGKQHCRIALGAFSNPLCLVDARVKIVVAVDQSQAHQLDPPFLSRFEKVPVSFSCLLSANQNMARRRIEHWVRELTSMAGTEYGGCGEALTGVTLHHSIESLLAITPDGGLDADEVCKKRLLRTASADGMVRSMASDLAVTDSEQARRWCHAYFEDEGHANLQSYLRLHAMESNNGTANAARSVFRAVVTTFTSMHMFVAARHLPEGLVWCHRRLGSFDTEASLADAIRSFFHDDTASLLLLECDAAYDQSHMLLARFLVDRESADHKAREGPGIHKVVVLLTHVSRLVFEDDTGPAWEVCFSEGWDNYNVDNLLLSNEEWSELRGFLDVNDLRTVVEREGLFEELTKSEIMSCFHRLRYKGLSNDPERSVAERILAVVDGIASNRGGVLGLMREKVLPLVEEEAQHFSQSAAGMHWLVNVATDRELLELSNFSLSNAVQGHLRRVVRTQVTKLIHALEMASTLDTYLAGELATEPLAAFARQAFLSDVFVDLRKQTAPMQVFEVGTLITGLRFPFSMHIFDSLAKDEQPRFLDEAYKLKKNATEEDREAMECEMDALRSRCKAQVAAKITSLLGPLAADGQQLLREDESFVQDMILLTMANLGHPAAAVETVMQVFRQLLHTLGLVHQPEAVLLLLWENMTLLRGLARLLGSNNTEDMLASFEGQGLQALAYHVSCETTGGMIATCCAGWEDTRQWAGRLDETLRLVSDVQEAADLPLDGSLYSSDRELLLLQRLYVLKTIQDVVSLVLRVDDHGPIALPFLDCGDRVLRMDEAFLTWIMDWLQPLLVRRVVGADQVAASVLERFLTCSTEVFYAERDHSDDDEDDDGGAMELSEVDEVVEEQEEGQEGEGHDADEREGEPPGTEAESFLVQPLFLAVCRHVCLMSDRPPVCLSLVLSQVLLEVANALDVAGYTPRDVIMHGALLPPPLALVIRPVQEVLGSACGTPLEVHVLDIMLADHEQQRESQKAGGDDDHMHVDDNDDKEGFECECFERAVHTVLKEVDGRDVDLMVVWYAHSFIKAFISRAAVALRDPKATAHFGGRILETLNAILSVTPTAESTQAVLYSLRIFLLKSLRLDLAALSTLCAEGGHLAALCPWVMEMDWQTQGKEPQLLAYNPFRSADGQGALDHATEAWDALHAHFNRRVEPLKQIVDSVVDGPEQGQEEGDAVGLTAALAKVVFMRTHAGPQQGALVDAQAREQLQRLGQATHTPAVPLLGRLCLATIGDFGGLAEQQRQGEGAAIWAMLMSLCVKMAVGACENPGHVLSAYALQPGSLPGSMMLAAESSELNAFVAALNEAVTRYRCPCGFIYLVGNCGQVTHASECPMCKRDIGGHQYGTPFEGQQRLDPNPSSDARHEEQPGYVFTARCANPIVHTERSLTPNQYRVLCLFVHASLLAGVLWHGDASYRGSMNSALLEPTVASHCYHVMKACADCLLQSLVPGGRLDLLGAFLHNLLEGTLANPHMATGPGQLCTTTQRRQQLEAVFASVCAERMADVVTVSARALDRFAEQRTPPLHRDLQELRPPSTSRHCMLYYRLTQEATPEALRLAFARDHANRERYPILDLFLQHAERLRMLRHLVPLVTWTNAVRKAKNLQISRGEARKMLHSALWEQREDCGEGPRLSKEHFASFCTAWNGVRDTIVCSHCSKKGKARDGCGCVEMWEMEVSLPVISSCLNLLDEGKVVSLVLTELAAVQNAFLTVCMQAAASAGLRTGLVSIPVQRATSPAVVVDPDALVSTLHKYGRTRLEYGSGFEVEFDLDKLQRVVLQACMHGKAVLDTRPEDLQVFRFTHETFATSNALFFLVEQRVPQVPVPDLHSLRLDGLVTDENEVSSRMMPALEALLYMLTTVQGKLDPLMPLRDFAAAWLDDVNKTHWAYYSGACSALGQLSLQHVEALYEVLEDTISEIIITSISDSYAEPLSPITPEEVMLLVDFAGGQRPFESAWRRFIVRYLRRPHPLPPDQPLVHYATLIRFQQHRGKDEGIEEREDLLALCARMRLGQSMTVLMHIREGIRRQEEEEELARRRRGGEESQAMAGKQGAGGAEEGGGGARAEGEGPAAPAATYYRFRQQQRTGGGGGRAGIRRTRGAAV